MIWRAAITLRFSIGRIKQPDIFKKLLGEMLLRSEPPLPAEWISLYDKKGGVIDRVTSYEVAVGCDVDSETVIPRHQSTEAIKEADQHQDPHEKPAPNKSVRPSNDRPLVDISKAPSSDRFVQLPAVTFHSLSCTERTSVIQCGGSLPQELSRANAARYLFKKGYLLQITDDTECVVPTLHSVPAGEIGSVSLSSVSRNLSIPIPGRRFNLSAICADGGLKHTNRAHPIYSGQQGTQRVMILSNGYKNHRDSILSYLAALDKWELGGCKDPLFGSDTPSVIKDEPPGTIIVYGSGGAPEVPGSYAPSANGNHRNEPSIIFPLSQSPTCPLNTELKRMTEMNEVVTVYVNEYMFLRHEPEHDRDKTVKDRTVDGTTATVKRRTKVTRNLPLSRKRKSDPSHCRCLGSFEMHSYSLRSDSSQEVIQSQRLYSTDLQLLSRFREVPYYRFVLRPLLDNDSINQLVHCGSASMKLIKVPCSSTDPIKIYVSTESMSQGLDLSGDRPLMREDIVQRYIEDGGLCKFGYELADVDENVLRDKNDSAEREIDDVLHRGMNTSLPDLVKALVLCQYSGAARYMGQSLVNIDGQRYATPLTTTKCALPSVFQYRPMPMPNRAMDGIAMCLREDARRSQLFDTVQSSEYLPRKVVKAIDHDDLLRITFKAIVLRFTGRISPHRLYAKHYGKSSWFPEITDLKDYLDFMNKTLPPTEDSSSSIARWISEQHAHSIPDGTKFFSFFSDFLNAVAKGLPDVVKQMVTQSSARSRAVVQLSDLLRTCCVTSRQNGNFLFLSQQIIADVEEIFDFPFGPVVAEGMISGSGSLQGYHMLNNGGLKSPSFAATLSTIVSYFEQSANEVDLTILGYLRAVKGGKTSVVNAVNDRPFNATDAEHFLCKCWIIAKYTLPHYANSVQPLSSKPHCHPLKKGESTMQLTAMNSIMEEVIASFEASDRKKDPVFCLMARESRSDGAVSLSSTADDVGVPALCTTTTACVKTTTNHKRQRTDQGNMSSPDDKSNEGRVGWMMTVESSDRQMEEPPRFCLMASERHGTKTYHHNKRQERPTLRLTGSSDESSTTEETM